MSLEFGGNFGTNSSNVYKKMVEFRNSRGTGILVKSIRF